MADRNLLILYHQAFQDPSDWKTVARTIAKRAPDIETRVADQAAPDSALSAWQLSRPSLVLSVRSLDAAGIVPAGGKVYAGQLLGKLEEMNRLAAAGFRVPKTLVLQRNMWLPTDEWGEFVVVKPTSGAFGRGIRVVRTSELSRRWPELSDMHQDMLVQRFVEHVDAKGRATTHRVLVMFGKALYAIVSRSAEPRPPLDWLADSPAHVAAANAAGDRHRKLLFDKDIIALAESTSAAFPDIPVLAVDILRETGTGALFITEVNASGGSWHLSSETGKKRYTAAFRASLYKQFNALERVAELLIEKTRAEAA